MSAVANTRFETAYQQLRQMLLTRKYLPRERLTEAELVATLGVSRSTVRSVLIRLQQEGFVEIEPNRGARVSLLSFEEFVQHFEVREVLEGLIARVAATALSDEALATLDVIYREMEQALGDGDIIGYLALNRRFHARIADGVGNHQAARMLRNLLPHLVGQQFQTVHSAGRWEVSLREHQAILRALHARDVEAAETAARDHARAFREAFVAANAQVASALQ
jgi:DNA-binding GntR family transcriptional regulator